jgi:hypothetical protein
MSGSFTGDVIALLEFASEDNEEFFESLREAVVGTTDTEEAGRRLLATIATCSISVSGEGTFATQMTLRGLVNHVDWNEVVDFMSSK